MRSVHKIPAIFAVVVVALLVSLLGVSRPVTVEAVSEGPNWIYGALKVDSGSVFTRKDGDQYTLTNNVLSEKVTATSYYNHKPSLTVETVHPTSVGYIGFSKALPLGETDWQQIIRRDEYNNTSFIGNPGDSGMLAFINSYDVYGSSPLSLRYVTDWRKMYVVNGKDIHGNVLRRLSPSFNMEDMPLLKKPDGGVLPIRATSAPAFSKNGRWLYLNSDIGQLRVTIPSLQYKIIQPRINSSYAKTTAISNSGRYSVASSHNNSYRLTVVDSENCPTSGNCAKRELQSRLESEYKKTLTDAQKLSGFTVVGAKFVVESKLEVYAYLTHGDGNSNYQKMYISVDPGAETVRYLAMGDSFSSGEGVGNYYEVTNFFVDKNNYNFCHQSRQAYSEVLNDWLAPDWYDSTTCSGAKMKDILFGAYDDDSEYIANGNPQARSLIHDENFRDTVKTSLRPGYIPQLSLLKANPSNVATLTIGGNDIGFGNIVTDCMLQPQCMFFRDDREKIADLIASKVPDLTSTYMNIKYSMSGDNPRLYVVGYPRMMSDDRLCSSTADSRMQVHANRLVDYLNSAIKTAADRAGVFYVDVSDAFVDKSIGYDARLCGNSPSAINGLKLDLVNKAGGQPLKQFLSSSFHPNKKGHALLAKKIKDRTDGLSLAMPPATFGTLTPSMEMYERFVGDTSDASQEVTSLDEQVLKNVVIEKGQNIDIYHTFTMEGGKPLQNTVVTVIVQSDPIVLGTIGVISDVIQGSFKLPDLELGMHSIHLKYVDSEGRPRDVMQYFFVVHSLDDLDGDGVPNEKDVCVMSLNNDVYTSNIPAVCEVIAEEDGPSLPSEPDQSVVDEPVGAGIIARPEVHKIADPTVAPFNINNFNTSSGTLGEVYKDKGVATDAVPVPAEVQKSSDRSSVLVGDDSLKHMAWGSLFGISVLAVIIWKRKRI